MQPSDHDPTSAALLNLRGAARYLDLGERTVERLVQTGRLPRVVLSERAVRFRRSDLDALIAASVEADRK